MTHVKEMLSRLPTLYREGELVSQVLGVPGLQLEILDEDGIEVRRSHWFDATLELDEAAKLAAVLDLPPESWQNLGEYRVWVHALRDAMLQKGAVTRPALQDFVAQYAKLYQEVANIRAIPRLEVWSNAPSTRDPAFLENPPVRRFQRIPNVGGVEPLFQFSVEQKGLDPTPADFLLTGLPTGPESVPVIVNLTTQEALVFLGNVPTGQRLWLKALPDGRVSAQLEEQDVTDRVRSVSGVTPGAAWEQAQVAQPARAITLARGRNDLWFLPVAHFDALGLDRFLLALADIAMSQGRYDQTYFDQAVFYQDPAVIFRLSWVETQPASFVIALPGGTLLNPSGRTSTALQSRNELEFSLGVAVKKLKAVGVSSSVILQPFQEVQPQQDYLKTVLPLHFNEVGAMGADRLPDAGGVFDVTPFNQSTFR